MKRVILDANILYPANLRNTLMYLTLADVFATLSRQGLPSLVEALEPYKDQI